ncbi:MAG: hypothetical protein ACKOOL_10840 [Novosphingobium sp.]
MSLSQSRVAELLIQASSGLLPENRKAWAAAMQAEAEAISDPADAIGFAWGCAVAAIKERMFTMKFAQTATKVVLFAWLGFMAAGTLYASTKFWGIHEPMGVVYAVITTTLWANIFWGLYRGPAALVQASSSMFFTSIVTFTLFRNEIVGGSEWTNLDFYRQMVNDFVIVSTIFLGVSLFLARRQRVASEA